MKVVQIATGVMQANCFLVYEEGSRSAFIVDPGAQAEKILAHIKHYEIEDVTHIFLTHGHFDHIGALAQLKEATGAKVCIHERDLSMLNSQEDNLAAFSGVSIKTCDADIVLKDGDIIEAAGMDVRVLHTPGHSGGSVCYIVDNVMFSGDTFFYMYCGRTDFPGSDPQEYHHSLNVILRSQKTNYHVYTGHGVKTTLFGEFENNPYFSR
ncbi:MAG: MBL fold metallo-hydrolase [Clostridia bacterium]|jgi:hydroxyacylglutathione hydrolase|nr:MBL fold metallo-hydrolase [Clostridia bacterium]MBT7121813.1 MBL fold metallo-hydrolase [Clostridia bacterium]